MQKTFKEVAESYGLSSPEQVKNRIIWNNLKAIMESIYGNVPGNSQVIAKYEKQWRLAEKEEIEKGL